MTATIFFLALTSLWEVQNHYKFYTLRKKEMTHENLMQ